MDDMPIENILPPVEQGSFEDNPFVEIEKPRQVEISLDSAEEVGSPEESIEQEETPKKAKGKQQDGMSRIKQLTRERFHAEFLARKSQEEAERLRAEVESLRRISEQNSQAA